MEYNWTESDIKLRIEKLQKLYDQTTDEEEKRIIKSQMDYVRKWFKHVHTNYRQPSALEAYRDLRKYVMDYPFTWDPILMWLQNSSEDYSAPGYPKIKLSNDDIMQATHDFYQTLPKEIYEQFLKDYIAKENHIRFRNSSNGHYYEGASFFLPTLGENFSEIIKSQTINDIFTAIHEHGHQLWSRFNTKCYFSNGFISEIIPFTMELIASDYLFTAFGEQAINQRGYYHKERLQEAKIWNEFYGILKAEEMLGEIKSKQDLLRASSIAGVKTNRLQSLLNLEAFPQMHTIIGYIYAIELYFLYKQDPDYASNIMQRIMVDETEEPEKSIQMLETLGLHANEHSKQFHEGMILSFKKN